ncbi:DUF222 domain-containing protein [Xylanimonas sp. McL0601]|uniref:HNH endonuclease signature motif containing protein n=1 Tax=Xylanimonas sp. McL0601 TaxID=3414739 RepID=UPI003CF852E9
MVDTATGGAARPVRDDAAACPARQDAAACLEDGLALLRAGVEALVTLAASGALHEVPAATLAAAQREIRGLAHRQDAVRLVILPVLEADGVWALDGSRSFPAWLARHDDVPRGVAHRETRRARTLRDQLPATRAAALAGNVGADHVTAMVSVCTSDARLAALAAPVTGLPARVDEAGTAMPAPSSEEFLLAQAPLYAVHGFQRLARHFAHVADPDADERGYRDATDREHLELGLTLGGYHVTGFLTEEHGTALRVALDAVMGVPAAEDERTVTQRRAQALADLARITLDHSLAGTGAAVRPHLTVTVSWAELKQALGAGSRGDDALDPHPASLDPGPANLDLGRVLAPRSRDRAGALDVAALLALERTPAVLEGSTGPLPDALLRKLACDSEISRIVFGPDGQILNVGRAQRTITGQLRRAVIARDQHCTWPGCHEPPPRCEVHHAERHWAAHHGETSTANAALLCWHHHTVVDTTGVTMRWHPTGTGTGTGGWRFADRHGNPIASTPRWADAEQAA